MNNNEYWDDPDDYEIDEQAITYQMYLKGAFDSEFKNISDGEAIDRIAFLIEDQINFPPENETHRKEMYSYLLESLCLILIQNGKVPKTEFDKEFLNKNGIEKF